MIFFPFYSFLIAPLSLLHMGKKQRNEGQKKRETAEENVKEIWLWKYKILALKIPNNH